MLQTYSIEKRALINRMLDVKGWLEGEFQEHRRNPFRWEEREDGSMYRVYHQGDSSFNGTLEWQKTMEQSLAKLKHEYEPYLEKDEPLKQHMWVGINPYSDNDSTADIDKLYQLLENLNKLKFYACIESHTENGYRPHIHMMLFTNHKPYRVRDILSKNFKCKKNFIETQNSSLYDAHIEYLRGNKVNTKLQFVEADIKEREEKGIPHFINFNSPEL
ncbi:MAG: putative replicase [Cressdnaviricota sp.]|nr:MAG: putative replicase [Cressdnaviricota sp.]